MATVTITITDDEENENGVSIHVEFEPGLRRAQMATRAQQVGLGMLEAVKSDRDIDLVEEKQS